MSEKTKVSSTGQCLCGKVEIEAHAIDLELGVCHCGMCRKWTAGPYLAVDCGSDLKIRGEENIQYYKSSEWASRAFCKSCGSSLFYLLKGKNQHIVSASLFPDIKPNLHHQIFIDKKPSYYNFAEESILMTEEQVFSAHQ